MFWFTAVPQTMLSPPFVAHTMLSPPFVPHTMLSPPLVPQTMLSPPFVPQTMFVPHTMLSLPLVVVTPSAPQTTFVDQALASGFIYPPEIMWLPQSKCMLHEAWTGITLPTWLLL